MKPNLASSNSVDSCWMNIELFCKQKVVLANLCVHQYLFHLIFRQFSLMTLASFIKSTHFRCMFLIQLVGYVFQVLWLVIRLNSILVINFMAFWTRTKMNRGDQLMQEESLRFPIQSNPNNKVSTIDKASWFQDVIILAVSSADIWSRQPLDSQLITQQVSFGYRDWKPCFSWKITEYFWVSVPRWEIAFRTFLRKFNEMSDPLMTTT